MVDANTGTRIKNYYFHTLTRAFRTGDTYCTPKSRGKDFKVFNMHGEVIPRSILETLWLETNGRNTATT